MSDATVAILVVGVFMGLAFLAGWECRREYERGERR